MEQGDLTLVTGATGFVGAAVARALEQAGYRLRLSARRGSDRRNLAGIQAEIVERLQARAAAAGRRVVAGVPGFRLLAAEAA